MSLFDPASRLGRGAGALLALAVATGCSTYNTKYPRSPSTAFQEYHATTLGRLFEPAAAEHPGESGVMYMRYGPKALEARLALADLAERSLDLQYYIWDADISGHLLADRIIRAADRGVRVRVLLDDLSIVDRDTAIAQLYGASQHRDPCLQPLSRPRQPLEGLPHRPVARQPAFPQQAHDRRQRDRDRGRAQHRRPLLRRARRVELPGPRHRGRGPGGSRRLGGLRRFLEQPVRRPLRGLRRHAADPRGGRRRDRGDAREDGERAAPVPHRRRGGRPHGRDGGRPRRAHLGAGAGPLRPPREGRGQGEPQTSSARWTRWSPMPRRRS